MSHFYKAAAVFVQLYRGCLHDSLKFNFGSSSSNNITAEKGPEVIPLVCNDFILNYLPLKCNIMDTELAIGLTKHFCQWLYNRKFT